MKQFISRQDILSLFDIEYFEVELD